MLEQLVDMGLPKVPQRPRPRDVQVERYLYIGARGVDSSLKT